MSQLPVGGVLLLPAGTGRRTPDTHTDLFLTVSAGAPGVAFVRRQLDAVGQAGGGDALRGLQAALDLTTETSVTREEDERGSVT